jgi:hypothetical protein
VALAKPECGRHRQLLIFVKGKAEDMKTARLLELLASLETLGFSQQARSK